MRLATCLLSFLAVCLAGGCNHLQLRKHTNQQLRTSSDIIQQQIMDGVAKVATNADAWPEFSNFANGTAQLATAGGGSLGLSWDARSFTEAVLGLNAGRELTAAWELNPTTDPARLRAMWAAYHYTVYGTTPETPYYSGSLQLRKALGVRWQELIPAPGWFVTCTEHEYDCAEKVNCGCVMGRYCDTRACVVSGNEAQLQQLTFVIMYLSGVTLVDKDGDPTGFPTGIPPLSEAAIPPSDTKGLRRVPVPTGVDGEGGLPRTGPAKDFYVPAYGLR